jgi:hypothetical protein
MDSHDGIRERGQADALATVPDEALDLYRHLSLIRVMMAAAAARELCRRGIPAPSGTWQYARGWADLMREMRNARASDGPSLLDVVRMIASGSSIDDPRREIMEAGLLLSRMQHGFLPPDPCPSEDYRRGWEAACQALRESPEARLLVEALAEVREGKR